MWLANLTRHFSQRVGEAIDFCDRAVEIERRPKGFRAPESSQQRKRRQISAPDGNALRIESFDDGAYGQAGEYETENPLLSCLSPCAGKAGTDRSD